MSAKLQLRNAHTRNLLTGITISRRDKGSQSCSDSLVFKSTPPFISYSKTQER